MTDTVLHIILAAAVACIAHYGLGMDWWTAGHFGAWTIIVREIAQAEERDNKVDFLRGLAIWRWGRQKHIETWVPVLVVEIVTGAMSA